MGHAQRTPDTACALQAPWLSLQDSHPGLRPRMVQMPPRGGSLGVCPAQVGQGSRQSRGLASTES